MSAPMGRVGRGATVTGSPIHSAIATGTVIAVAVIAAIGIGMHMADMTGITTTTVMTIMAMTIIVMTATVITTKA